MFFLSLLLFFFFLFVLFFVFFFFFFSSRRRHTRWNCDWSSDVCSSDLAPHRRARHRGRGLSCPWHLARDGRMAQLATERRRRSAAAGTAELFRARKIGRASCRERV